MKYAAKTEVNSERSRNEIERTLARYGAHSFMYGTSPRQAVIAFEMRDRRIRFDLPMPDLSSKEIARTETGKARVPEARKRAYEQAVRQRWRALALMIKAKLEAVESGITEFQEEFLAHIVLPDGSTVGQHLLPQIAHVRNRPHAAVAAGSALASLKTDAQAPPLSAPH